MFDDLGGDLRGSHERAEVLSGRDMIGRGRFCLGRLIAITDSLAVIFREQQIHALQKVVTLEPYVQIPILEDANADIVYLDQGWQRSAHACRLCDLGGDSVALCTRGIYVLVQKGRTHCPTRGRATLRDL